MGRIDVRSVLAIALFIGLMGGSFINYAIAANTHSLDLESDSSQYLSISDASQTGLDIGSAGSLSAWVKFESQPTSGNSMMIVSKYDNTSGNQRSYQFRYFNEGGTLKLTFAFSDNGNGVSGRSQIQTLNNDTWYHVAVTYSGANNRVRFYVNGSQVGSDLDADSVPTIFNSSAPFRIGNVEDFSTNISHFDGLIDDVRVWGRELSVSEMTGLYNDSENFSNGSNLVGWWKFDNDYTDASGNGNTLTPSNGPVFSTDTPVIAPPPPPPFSEDLEVYKSVNQSVVNSIDLQEDNALVLGLDANKTYSVEGILFLSSVSAKADIKIQFEGETGTDSMVGYITGKESGVLASGATSPQIDMQANTPLPVFIKGTVETGSTAGEYALRWAQAKADISGTTVMSGSYLRAEEL